jgi:iron complex transport system substrate-binding protein
LGILLTDMGNSKTIASVLILAVVAGLASLAARQCLGTRGSVEAVEVQSPRIVSMAPNLTEILFALGLGDHLAAVTRNCDYPPAAADKPDIGTFWQPDIERIVAVRPELLVALDIPQHQAIVSRFRQQGCACLSLQIDTLEQLAPAIRQIAAATDHRREGELVIQGLDNKLKVFSSRALTVRPRVLWVVQRDPLRVAGTKTFIGDLIRLAGGVNAVGPTIYDYPPIGAEELLAAAPEVIIEPSDNPDSSEQKSQADFWSRYPALPAVQNHRLYLIPSAIVSRLGPRIPDAVAEIADRIHPPAAQP